MPESADAADIEAVAQNPRPEPDVAAPHQTSLILDGQPHDSTALSRSSTDLVSSLDIPPTFRATLGAIPSPRISPTLMQAVAPPKRSLLQQAFFEVTRIQTTPPLTRLVSTNVTRTLALRRASQMQLLLQDMLRVNGALSPVLPAGLGRLVPVAGSSHMQGFQRDLRRLNGAAFQGLRTTSPLNLATILGDPLIQRAFRDAMKIAQPDRSSHRGLALPQTPQLILAQGDGFTFGPVMSELMASSERLPMRFPLPSHVDQEWRPLARPAAMPATQQPDLLLTGVLAIFIMLFGGYMYCHLLKHPELSEALENLLGVVEVGGVVAGAGAGLAHVVHRHPWPSRDRLDQSL